MEQTPPINPSTPPDLHKILCSSCKTTHTKFFCHTCCEYLCDTCGLVKHYEHLDDLEGLENLVYSSLNKLMMNKFTIKNILSATQTLLSSPESIDQAMKEATEGIKIKYEELRQKVRERGKHKKEKMGREMLVRELRNKQAILEEEIRKLIPVRNKFIKPIEDLKQALEQRKYREIIDLINPIRLVEIEKETSDINLIEKGIQFGMSMKDLRDTHTDYIENPDLIDRLIHFSNTKHLELLYVNDRVIHPLMKSNNVCVYYPKASKFQKYTILDYWLPKNYACINFLGDLAIFGGTTQEGTPYINDVVFIKISDCRAVEKKGMPEKLRCSGVMAIDNNQILLMGGQRENLTFTARCNIYNVKEDKWSEHSSMQEAKANIGCCRVADYIYIFGGYTNNSALSTVERCNILEQKPLWTIVANLPTPIQIPGVVYLDNKEIFVFGRKAPDRRDIRSFFFHLESFQCLPKSPMPVHDSVLSEIPKKIGDSIYVFGHHTNTFNVFSIPSNTWTTKDQSEWMK